MFLRLLLLLVHWSSGSFADQGVRQLTIGPFSIARSQTLTLTVKQAIRLSTESKSNISLDVFIYDADTKELVGKSDDDVVEPYYEWSPRDEGRYFIVVRNPSSGSGTATISILPRASSRTVSTLPKPDYAAMNVYYATDRVLVTPNNRHAIYGTDPGLSDQLNFGMATVSIPRSHLMGELEGPSILRLEFREDPERHVVLVSATPEDRQHFFENVAQRISLSANRQALVFVPGFNVSFEDATRRTAQIAYDLGFDGAAILYSWPSQGKLSLINYEKDARNANLSVPHLRSFLTQLAEQTGVKTIHLIAHSMGNQVTVKALAALGEAPVEKSVRIRHVALMAPDIDATEFRRLAVAMKKVADDITLYASSGDTALKASETLAGYPRAGANGKDLVVLPGVVETIDCSSVDTSLLGLGHSYYADNSTILSDLFRLIRGDPAKARFRLKSMRNAEGTYWVFVPTIR